jgi:outer membrane protein assembly factor BamB
MKRKHQTASAVLMCAAGLLFLAACEPAPTGAAPATPAAPAGATSGARSTDCPFSATTTDPDGDSVCFRFQWDTGVTSEWSDYVASGETVSMSHAWSDSGTYAVKAQAKDRPGNASDWSAALTVVIGSNRAPDAPAIPAGPATAPMDSACYYSCIATDPDGDGIRYRFDWGNGDTSEWSDWAGNGEPGGATYAFPDTGTFLVRAQARDAGEARSAWSNPLTVVVTIPFATVRWRYQTGDFVSGCPAIAADGTIYLGSCDDYLYAINADGSLKWRYKTGNSITNSPAIAADGTVYAVSGESLHAINPDGTLQWHRQLDSYSVTGPAAAVGADGTIYVGTDMSDSLYALNPDGTRKWTYYIGAPIWTVPAIAADGTVYVGSNDTYLYAIKPNGSFKWRYKTGSDVHSTPAIATNGTVYFGSADNYLYAINSQGLLEWRYRTNGGLIASPAIAADGTIYIGSEDTYLYAVNPDGSAKWRYRTDDGVNSGPAVTDDGSVIFGSDDSCLYAVNADGSLRWRCKTDGKVSSSPAIAPDGTIYFGSFDWNIYALWGSSPLANSAWPKCHHDSKNTGRAGGGGR